MTGRRATAAQPWGAVVAVVVLVAGCGWLGDDIEYYGAYEPEPGELVVELRVCTIGNEDATVSETDAEVRIDDVTATLQPSGNDCSGAFTIELDGPLGDRAVFVGGERWIPYAGTCDRLVTLVPPDVPSWFTECPAGPSP